MSDREASSKRKYLLLVIPVLLLLGWFAFAPGNDQKNADTTNTKTTQKQASNKDDEDKTEGQVASAATTEASTSTTDTTPTWRPSPNVRVASVVTGTPQQQPAPQNPQTPPVDTEEPTEPECEVYDGQIIALQPGEFSSCYILANENEENGCWIPALPYAFADNPSELFWFGELLDEELSLEEMPMPYLVIENRSALDVSQLPEDMLPEEMDLEYLCPTYESYIQFHVQTGSAVSTLPGDEYDYVLPVVNVVFSLEDLLASLNGESEAGYPEVDFACYDVLVNVIGDESEMPLYLDCEVLLEFLSPIIPTRPV